MDPFAIKAIQLFLSLSILIVLHELGHYIPAKIFKTRVEKFFLFFDIKFALFKKKIGETVYGIGWLPLGGYVKIAGMIDESMDKEQMAQPPQPWEFRSKPTWQRLIIMLGGVTMNIIVGVVIFMFLLGVWGRKIVPAENIPDGFAISQTFKELGFRDGDRILQVNGKDFEDNLAINKYLFLREVNTITVVHQDGQTETLSVPEDSGKIMFERGEIEPFVPVMHPVLDTVIPGKPAYEAGLRKSDRITAINGAEYEHFHTISASIKKSLEESGKASITVLRDGTTSEFEVESGENNTIGIAVAEPYTPVQVKYGPGESFVQGFKYTYWTLHDYIYQFKYLFTKKGATEVGGFGAIGNMFPGTWNWAAFWQTTALISIILAFMNILPIPALDGGHVMFLLYEMFTGRKPSDKFLEYAQMIGFFLLIALVLYANGNDIYRWLFK